MELILPKSLGLYELIDLSNVIAIDKIINEKFLKIEIIMALQTQMYTNKCIHRNILINT